MKLRFVIGLTAIGVVLLVFAVAAFAVRSGRGEGPQLPASEAQAPLREVRVVAVERKAVATVAAVATAVSDASRAVAVVCGADSATADRYEARSDALRSIARRRDLLKNDVAALMAYLRFPDDALRAERVAALKNDVMNLLRNQDPMPEELAELLLGMLEGDNRSSLSPTPIASDFGGVGTRRPTTLGGGHPPAVLDYSIQHLGAMQNSLDDATRLRVRRVFLRAARNTRQPYAGTALYSLAEDKRATAAQEGELRRLTLALCKPGVNNVARIAAIQLAGQRGYAEALPVLCDTLSGEKRDAVLDTVCIGSVGLLGNEDDIALLERFRGASRRSAAVEAAIKRIKGREESF